MSDKKIGKVRVDFVPISQAARMTGMSAPTIKKAVEAGILSFVKTPGGQTFVSVDDIAAWMTPRKASRSKEDGQHEGESS